MGILLFYFYGKDDCMIPDYAHPIRDNTRDEVFCVPVSNCLFNTNLAIYQYILEHPEKFDPSKFSKLQEIEKDPNKRFYQLSLYSECEFFAWLQMGDSYDSLSKDDFMKQYAKSYIDIRMNWDPIRFAPRTTFLGAILHLLSIGVIKKLYLYDDIAQYDQAMKALVTLTFQLASDPHFDVTLLNGGALDIYDSPYFQEITTFVIGENEILHQILMQESKKNPSFLRKMYFILPRLKLTNFTKESISLTSPTYWILNHFQDYLELEKQKLFHVGYFTMDPFSQGGLLI